MADEIAVGIGTIIVLGVVAQLVAKRLGTPAILFLLLAGVVAGPALGLVDTDEIFGDALFPIVNLGVGLLLFQGGMELDFRKLSDRSVLPRLLTIGVALTGVLATLAVMLLFDFTTGESAILGAVLIVSGPTVVIPLLQSARVKQPVDGILRAEGIFIDPIGAAIGYVTLQVVLASSGDDKGLLIISAVGIGTGLILAVLLLAMLRNFLVPDEYEMALGITFAVIAVTVADAIAPESGFFAATVLGVVLANQRRTTIEPIMRFGETLNVFVIGALFVLLAARVDLEAVWEVADETAVLVAIMVLVIRPLAVVLCTTPSSLSFKERFYLASIAPRGIVAAATSSLFAITLEQNGEPFEELVPVTFGVIFLTALLVTFGAVPLARVLGLRRPDPTGVAMVGWDRWMIDLGRALDGLGVPVVLIAPGAAALEDVQDVPYPVMLDTPTAEEARDIRDVAAQVLVATDDEVFNRAVVTTGIVELGRGQVHLVPQHGDEHAPGGSSHTVRVPFTGARTLAELRAGGPIRVLEPGDEVGDATVLARVRRPAHKMGRTARVDLTPDPGPLREHEAFVVQLRSASA